MSIPIKDEDEAHPVASAWRPVLGEVVKCFAAGNYTLSNDLIKSVVSIDANVADQIRKYILDYGEKIVELPEATWHTSVSQWMGNHWEVLVDLWTEESGESDLVLNVRVFESGNRVRIEVDSVHVP